MPEDCTGGCVNFIVVLYITRLELDFINNCAVLYIQLNVHVIDGVRIHTGMVPVSYTHLAQAYYEYLAGNIADQTLNAYATRSMEGEAL